MAAPTNVSSTTPQTGAAQTLAVNMPASVGATDLIVVYLGHGGTIGAMPGSPVPFTGVTTTDAIQDLAYLQGADHITNGSPATYTFTTSVGQQITRAMASRINGAPLSGSPFDVTSVTGTTAASTSSASLTITTVHNDTLLLNYDNKSSSVTNTSAPTGLTLQTAATNATHHFTGALATAGSSGAKVSGYALATNHRSLLAAIKPITAHTVSSDLVGDGVTTRVLAETTTRDVTGDGVTTRILDETTARSLTGDGVITRVVAEGTTRDLTGDGTVSRGVVAVTVNRDLTGDGVITESHAQGLGRSFDLVGDGTVDAAKAVVASKTFDLSGDGVVTESHATGIQRAFDLTGDGVISGSIDIPFPVIPECAPDWSPNDGLKAIAGDVFFHEPPNEGDPVAGADVCLFRDSDGARIECTTTDGAGHYTFARDTNDPYTYHVEVRYLDQQGLSEGGCVPS